MAQSASTSWTPDEFFAWQERQANRYELVDGLPVRMMAGAGAKNRHDDIVVNILIALGNQLRGSACRPFTGDGSIETYPGQIRRPDVGVDCGRREGDAYRAAEPKLVVEVLSPSTRDFDTIGKIEEYKAVDSLDYILVVEPNAAEIRVLSREPDRSWTPGQVDGLEAAVECPSLELRLPLAEIYDGVGFPPGPVVFRS